MNPLDRPTQNTGGLVPVLKDESQDPRNTKVFRVFGAWREHVTSPHKHEAGSLKADPELALKEMSRLPERRSVTEESER
ncbi:hypothetical protein EYF80_049600 [Liparis tanakae]|uniref:Uncharacterized protein n=1 Tax=Liparis tanakae TaxID=230148 RepID=A0A4Z2FG75_9TELE|nr:hypothetical protein EYF80_049600 [Liparis tanakae]